MAKIFFISAIFLITSFVSSKKFDQLTGNLQESEKLV